MKSFVWTLLTCALLCSLLTSGSGSGAVSDRVSEGELSFKRRKRRPSRFVTPSLTHSSSSVEAVAPITKPQLEHLRHSATSSLEQYRQHMSAPSPSLLCHMIIMHIHKSDTASHSHTHSHTHSGPTKHHMLWNNIAAATHHCSWAVSWLIAPTHSHTHSSSGLNTTALEQHALLHNTTIVHQQEIHYTKTFNKITTVWKQLLNVAQRYSHVWLLDSDISLTHTNMERLYTAWSCGTLTHSLPPILTQPSIITVSGKPQAPDHVNHTPHYTTLGFSVATTALVEIQAPIIASAFLTWFITEIIVPHVESLIDFEVSEWGTDLIWCRAATMYTRTRANDRKKSTLSILPCALLSEPVRHLSTRTLKLNRHTRLIGERVKYFYEHKFPMFYLKKWKTESKRLASLLQRTHCNHCTHCTTATPAATAAEAVTTPLVSIPRTPSFGSRCRGVGVSRLSIEETDIFFLNESFPVAKGDASRSADGCHTGSSPLSSSHHDTTATTVVSLLAGGVNVTASTQGQLAPPDVVLSPVVTHWLQHRWQAASDMSGTPVPGPHWLQFDLQHSAVTISRVIIDYEVALSVDYYVSVWCDASHMWVTVFDSKDKRDSHNINSNVKSKQHIIHDIRINYNEKTDCRLFSKIRLDIRRPATRFGTSVWHFDALGVPAEKF